MNYIQLLNNFWSLNREIGFNAHETQVYFYLLNESNRANWKNPIPVSTNILTAELKISRKTLTTVRENLSKYGLIKYVCGIKNESRPTYELIYVSQGNINGNMNGNMNGNINGNINGNMNGNMNGNHLNKHKPIQKQNNISSETKFSDNDVNDVLKAVEESLLTNEQKQKRWLAVQDELLNSTQWHDEVAIALEKKSLDIPVLIREFINIIRADGQYFKPIKDIKIHFRNWAKRNKNNIMQQKKYELNANPPMIKDDIELRNPYAKPSPLTIIRDVYEIGMAELEKEYQDKDTNDCS